MLSQVRFLKVCRGTNTAAGSHVVPQLMTSHCLPGRQRNSSYVSAELTGDKITHNLTQPIHVNNPWVIPMIGFSNRCLRKIRCCSFKKNVPNQVGMSTHDAWSPGWPLMSSGVPARTGVLPSTHQCTSQLRTVANHYHPEMTNQCQPLYANDY